MTATVTLLSDAGITAVGVIGSAAVGGTALVLVAVITRGSKTPAPTSDDTEEVRRLRRALAACRKARRRAEAELAALRGQGGNGP